MPESGRVAVVRRVSRTLVELDSRVGGPAVGRRAARQGHRAWRRLRPARPGTGRELRAVAAELMQVVGWIAFDAERQRDAALFHRRAVRLARLAGDTGTELFALINTSMQQAHTGRPDLAFRTASGLLESRRLTPRVEAMVRIRAARALSLAGRDGESRYQFRRARSLLSEPGAAEPAWAWWIDEAELDGHEGAARIELADRRAAVPLLEAAAGSDLSDAPQCRSLFPARLLLCYLELGAWSDASRVAEAMAPGRAGGTGSVRTARVLRRAALVARHRSRAPGSLVDIAVALGGR